MNDKIAAGEAPPSLAAIIEALLLSSPEPLSVRRLQSLFVDEAPPSEADIRQVLGALIEHYGDRPMELVEVADGFRLQVRSTFTPWINRLWERRPPRYSRAFLEILSLIAYKQPITRGDIERIRGVSVNSTIIRTLLDRGWIRVAGHREVPGRPVLFATTAEFLNYFGLTSLADLPPLPDIEPIDDDQERGGKNHHG